jgi:hypothetical protein
MATVTNNTPRTPLGLPGGIVVAPGESKNIPGWAAIKDNAIVKAWVKAKVLTVEGFTDAPTPAVQTQVVADEKDEILRQLAELGIRKDKRTSLEKLKAALDEALAS